jgi:hypothetical protein
MSTPSLFCIFADDVRQESNGKQLIVGMYQGGMNFAAPLPATLPQLFIVGHLMVPADCPPIEHIKFSAVFDGETIVEVEPPPEALAASVARIAPGRENGEISILQISVGLQPFKVPKPGKITTKMEINRSQTVVGNSLNVAHLPAQPQAASS